MISEAKKQPVSLPRPVKRADPEAVATEGELVAVLVVKGDGELSAQAFEHFFLTLFPQMGDDFRVAMRVKAMTARC